LPLLHRADRPPHSTDQTAEDRSQATRGDRGWMVRTPRPVHLPASIRTSTAGSFGISPRRVRAADAQHPFYGVTAFGLDLDDVRTRCEAFLPNLLPGQVFSHTTALALAGCPLPNRVEADLHVSVVFPRT